MPVFEGSRYEGVEYTAIVGQDLITRKYLHLRTPKAATEVDPDWIVHEFVVGDDLDLLAYLYSGNNANKSKLWWIIADVNGTLWPLDLEPGTDMVIPVNELSTEGTL
jgi:hypothetical protein